MHHFAISIHTPKRPRLQQLQLVTEKVLLLLHFELEHAGLAAHGEEVSDRGARGLG
jgi:hypothetical protein